MKLLLSIICIALLALFAYQVMSFPLNVKELQNTEVDRTIFKSIDYDLPQLAVLNSREKYTEIVQRPLFVKGRVPAAGVRTIDSIATVNELSHLVLVGTARSTEVQIGIIADTKAKQMERLKVGETYKDWKIAEVSSDYVLFRNAEFEHKLFVTPIKGSQKDKQAKLISQLNKSKIDRAAAAIKSYQESESEKTTAKKSKRNVSERSWGYNKKHKQENEARINSSNDNSKIEKKQVRRSPIKIPNEEEKDASYYEGLDDADTTSADYPDSITRELSAEDFYDDENITEDELQALEALGAKIFDD